VVKILYGTRIYSFILIQSVSLRKSHLLQITHVVSSLTCTINQYKNNTPVGQNSVLCFINVACFGSSVSAVIVLLDTHDIVTAEVSRYPAAADVDEENHVLAEVSAVGQTAQGDETFPGQEHIHRACGYDVITATSLNGVTSRLSVLQQDTR
jgi:hypothetical protein